MHHPKTAEKKTQSAKADDFLSVARRVARRDEKMPEEKLVKIA